MLVPGHQDTATLDLCLIPGSGPRGEVLSLEVMRCGVGKPVLDRVPSSVTLGRSIYSISYYLIYLPPSDTLFFRFLYLPGWKVAMVRMRGVTTMGVGCPCGEASNLVGPPLNLVIYMHLRMFTLRPGSHREKRSRTLWKHVRKGPTTTKNSYQTAHKGRQSLFFCCCTEQSHPVCVRLLDPPVLAFSLVDFWWTSLLKQHSSRWCRPFFPLSLGFIAAREEKERNQNICRCFFSKIKNHAENRYVD
jgi:hypothetical protein